MSTFMPDPKLRAAFELGMGLVDVPFDIPNLRCENGEAQAHVRIGWFRSVSNIPHAFAVQSFVAELAHELGKDPKDMLLELIGPARKLDLKATGIVDDSGTMAIPTTSTRSTRAGSPTSSTMAADGIGWGRQLPKGRGLGIAVHRSFLTYVATAIEVEVTPEGRVSVPRVDTAIDCGFAVNPERIRSQVEGAAVMGMSLAMYSEVSFKNGRAEQSNFDTYELARMDSTPLDVRTHIVQHGYDTPASGVGEPPLPPFAPALCNAIFAATGKRIRSLPIAKHDLKSI